MLHLSCDVEGCEEMVPTANTSMLPSGWARFSITVVVEPGESDELMGRFVDYVGDGGGEDGDKFIEHREYVICPSHEIPKFKPDSSSPKTCLVGLGPKRRPRIHLSPV